MPAPTIRLHFPLRNRFKPNVGGPLMKEKKIAGVLHAGNYLGEPAPKSQPMSILRVWVSAFLEARG